MASPIRLVWTGLVMTCPPPENSKKTLWANRRTPSTSKSVAMNCAAAGSLAAATHDPAAALTATTGSTWIAVPWRVTVNWSGLLADDGVY